MSKETRCLILFFTATIAATYAAYFTIVFQGWNPYEMPGLVLFLIGGSAPTWVGLGLVLLTYDREQRKEYFKRLLPRLITGRMWALIVLIFPFSYAVTYAIELLLGGSLPGMEPLRAYIAQPAVLPLVVLIGLGSGPISEEFGWRGVALDPLIRRFGRISGSVVLGLVWGIWHLGLFFMPQTWHGKMGLVSVGFITFMLMSVGLALVMTWVHTHTGGSILAALLIHFFSNFTSTALMPHTGRAEIIQMIVILGLGLFVCLSMERQTRRRTAVINTMEMNK